ncbi:uncharacterized protein VTP21DRAFT_3850 [Calcarisporiella thermophila]|uniref:uncharacterized protein n=1 Tax=Calcarisporiella thermophila TaxID=911321 RepID=UPI003743E0EF
MWERGIIYELIVGFFSFIIHIFFREVKSRGSHMTPKTGPVIFVAAPHANQFVDPLMIMRSCRRKISFLIAEKSYHRKVIGAFAKAAHSIPVARPQDITKSGQGLIFLKDPTKPRVLTGEGTSFSRDFGPRYKVVFPLATYEVAEVVSDSELLLTKDVSDANLVELLKNGAKYKIMPHVDQSRVYGAVYKELDKGGCFGIFPEGGSHDRAELLPLKAGVTIMALGAMANNPNLDLKIVPCGLNYFHAHKFRSRAVVEFGKPLTIPKHLVEKFTKGGEEKRQACGELLDMIYKALLSVTVNTPDYETLMVIQATRRLYRPQHHHLKLSEVVELNRRLVIGYNKLKDEPEVKELRRKVLAYNQILKYYGLKDHQVGAVKTNRLWAFSLLVCRFTLLVVLGALALPSLILNFPVIIVAKIISYRKAKEALASSSVKIRATDVMASWKLIVALVLVPLLYSFYAIIAFMLAVSYGLPLRQRLAAPILTSLVILPAISYAGLRFGENGLDIYRSLKPLLMAILPNSRCSVEALRNLRERLAQDITTLINERGPQIFADFDTARIIPVHHEEVQPDDGFGWTLTSEDLEEIWGSGPNTLQKKVV